jgi:hypothetical protein
MSRWAVLVLMTLAHALGALTVLSVAPLSPFLLDALLACLVLAGFGFSVLNPSTGKAVVELGELRNTLIGSGAYALPALGDRLPVEGLVPLAIIAGVGALGWVGLYFALVADLGDERDAGLLTGVAVAFAWSGVLVRPPIFGLVVDRTGSRAWPWLGLACVGVAVAAVLPWPAPLVEREPGR